MPSTAKAYTRLEANREGIDVLQWDMLSMFSPCIADHIFQNGVFDCG